MNYNLRFRLILGLLAVLKNSVILLKYSNFEGFFSYFHGQNKYKITVSVHSRVCTKKLINTKLRKLQNFAFTFLGRLKHTLNCGFH